MNKEYKSVSFGYASRVLLQTKEYLESNVKDFSDLLTCPTDEALYEKICQKQYRDMHDNAEDPVSCVDEMIGWLSIGKRSGPRALAVEALSAQCDDIYQAVRKAEFRGLIDRNIRQNIRNIGFFPLVEHDIRIRKPDFFQLVKDVCGGKNGRERADYAIRLIASIEALNTLVPK